MHAFGLNRNRISSVKFQGSSNFFNCYVLNIVEDALKSAVIINEVEYGRL